MQNETVIRVMDGVIRCSRYAFGPNRLHYCGPDANQEIYGYIKEGTSDAGLKHLLGEFETMYPYLKHIAQANNIADPLDVGVVDAYWIGNSLLERAKMGGLYKHLTEGLRIHQRMSPKNFSYLRKKVEQNALPHHSFHVLNVWQEKRNLENMRECLISWGEVKSVAGPSIEIETPLLDIKEGKLCLSEPVSRTIYRRLEAEYDIEQIIPGSIITVHWGSPCEVISESQAMKLKRYTLESIALANKTL